MEGGTPRASKLYSLKLLSFHEPLHKKVRPIVTIGKRQLLGINAENLVDDVWLPLDHFRCEVDILFGYLSGKVSSFPHYEALDNTGVCVCVCVCVCVWEGWWW